MNARPDSSHTTAIMKRRVLPVVGLVLILPSIALAIMSSMAKRPDNLGVRDGRLAECPDKPNCVCTQATTAPHAIDPLRYQGTAADAMRRLRSIVESQAGATIVTQEENYLHAEFQSKLFRFVDDVEFLIAEDDGLIHFRSASRIGHSDLGANRQRMEAIRAQYEQNSPRPGSADG